MKVKATSREPESKNGGVVVAVLLSALLLVFLAATAAPAAEPTGYKDWEAQMQAYFDAHPELRNTGGEERGTGWEPFNRYKWFYDQRMSNGEEIPAGARWNAFQRKQELAIRNKTQASATWFSLGPQNFAGRTLALAFDPVNTNNLYAGAADGGIWKSTDAGLTWTALDDELPTLSVNAIVVSPIDPNIVVIGTGEATSNIDRVGGVGILRSTDGGATWGTTSVSFGVNSGHGFHCMDANPTTGTMLAGATDSLYRSTDNGATWAGIRVGNWTDIKYKPGSADTVYAVRTSLNNGDVNSGVRISTDDGASWTKHSSGLPSALLWGKCKLAVTAANPLYVYIVIASASTAAENIGVYRTTDGTTSWTLRGIPTLGSQNWYNLMLVADPNNAERILVAGQQGYRSNDGGTTYPVTFPSNLPHVDYHASAYRPGTNNDVFVGSDGGVWESTNDGAAWNDRNTGYVTYQFYDICVSQVNALLTLGGTQDQGTDRWTGTTTWARTLGGDGMVCNCAPSDVNRVYAEQYNGNHFRSDTGGAGAFFPINNGIVTGTGALWVEPVDVDATTADHVYTASDNGVYRTTDGGSNWVNVLSPSNASTLSISHVDPNIVWAFSGGVIKVTTDDGATWNAAAPFGFPVGASGSQILAHPTDSQTAFMTFGTYSPVSHIARTTDLGATWQDVTGDFPPQPVNTIAVDPLNTEHWFIGTDVGVWASGTEGQSWIPFETGLPNVVVDDLEIQASARKLRAGTHGRGMWEVDLSTTGVTPAVPQAISLMLDPPSPNPLRDGTVLRYAARMPGANLSLRVYDVQGRLVSVVAEHAADGLIRQVKWNAGGVADGVYFARLTAGSQEKSQRIVVIK